MYQLTPYRPGFSVMGLRGAPKNSPVRYISIALIALIWVGTVFFGFLRGGDSAAPFLWFIVAIVATIAIPFGLRFIWQVLASSKLDKLDVQVSTNQLQPGIELCCSSTQQVKSRLAVQDAALKLVTLEWVQYTDGTTTRTETHYQVIDEMRIDGGQYESGDTLRLDATLHVPENAVHNFHYAHNRLQWLVVVNVGIPMWPAYYEEFELNFPAGA